MKKNNNLRSNNYLNLIIFFLVFLTVSSCKYDEDYLIGNWIGYGYNCYEDKNIKELIDVRKINESYVGIKQKGDNCIITGDTTWIAFNEKDSFRIFVKAYDGIKNVYFFNEAEINIVNKDSFNIEISNVPILTFSRI